MLGERLRLLGNKAMHSHMAQKECSRVFRCWIHRLIRNRGSTDFDGLESRGNLRTGRPAIYSLTEGLARV